MAAQAEHAVAMDDVAFNRLGILLSFVASFLIAPELIGLERFQRLEDWLESQGSRLASVLEQVRQRVDNEDILVIGSGLAWIAAIAFGVSAWLSANHVGPREIWVVGVAALGLIGVGGVVVFGWFFAFIGLTLFMYLVRRLIRSLSGDDRLAARAVTAGIVCFVLGNLFQLVATF